MEVANGKGKNKRIRMTRPSIRRIVPGHFNLYPPSSVFARAPKNRAADHGGEECVDDSVDCVQSAIQPGVECQGGCMKGCRPECRAHRGEDDERYPIECKHMCRRGCRRAR